MRESEDYGLNPAQTLTQVAPSCPPPGFLQFWSAWRDRVWAQNPEFRTFRPALDSGAGNPDTFVRDMGIPPTSNSGPTIRVSVGGDAQSPIVDNTQQCGCAWGCRPSVVHVPQFFVSQSELLPGMVVVAFVALAPFDQYDDNGAWDVYVRVIHEDHFSFNCGNTYLVSAPPPATSQGPRTAADLANFNPSLRAERDPMDPTRLILRIAFESFASNLVPGGSDTNDTRDIYYAELVVVTPVGCAQ